MPAIASGHLMCEFLNRAVPLHIVTGGDPALTINPDSIAQIALSKKNAQALIQIINRGIITKAWIINVKNNIIKERKRLRRLIKKVIDLRDNMVTEKAEIKALKSKRREKTPATGITAGLSTIITKKKKNLDHPKRLNNSKNPSYKF